MSDFRFTPTLFWFFMTLGGWSALSRGEALTDGIGIGLTNAGLGWIVIAILRAVWRAFERRAS